jgi:hypothetical protein
MGLATLASIVSGAALLATVSTRLRSLWLAATGAVAALVWWVVADASGCDSGLEVSCSWQPLANGVFALVLLAPWLGGIALGKLVRRLR